MAMHLLSRVVTLMCILLVIRNAVVEASRKSSLSRQKLEIQNYLNRVNKPPVKSIKSPDGDIIDCVLIAQQPAFDHPSLKNHTIQMRPNYLPEGVSITNKVHAKGSKPITQLWQLNGRCPKGTIPIRRTKEEDLLRASSIRRFGRKKHKTILNLNSTKLDNKMTNNVRHQYVLARIEGERYYGAKTTINVWNPKVQSPFEFSLSQIWIAGGSGKDLNTIEVGSQVYPFFNGDSGTRLFVYWTNDAYQNKGCYNLLCPGFIHLNKHIVLGGTIYPISSYGGSQYDITLYVWKDSVKGHWWLIYGNNTVVGYWPNFLLPNMHNSASIILMGGEILNMEDNNQHTTTQMGSGHFSKEGFGKASYFRNIEVIDDSKLLGPPKNLRIGSDNSNCYDIKNGNSAKWKSFFYYGGPGRNHNCP